MCAYGRRWRAVSTPTIATNEAMLTTAMSGVVNIVALARRQAAHGQTPTQAHRTSTQSASTRSVCTGTHNTSPHNANMRNSIVAGAGTGWDTGGSTYSVGTQGAGTRMTGGPSGLKGEPASIFGEFAREMFGNEA